MKSKNIIILSLLFLTSLVYGQQVVSGFITTSAGDPLIGVNVLEQGTSNGTITDLDGSFSLTINEGTTLIISYTGYETQEVTVGNQSSFDIILVEGSYLDEVVVTALNIGRKKRALAYSVGELDGSSVATAKEVNIGNALAGKIAGVNVSKPASGAGGSSRIVIRGNGNISGNNQPLIVVDGVPISNSNLGSAGMWGGQDFGDGLSSVNSDDVESMTVLKGNTAGALYGYRADNGVILITTKKGNARQGVGVEFNSSFLAESFVNNTNFQQEYGHGAKGVKPSTLLEAQQNGLSGWGSRLDGSSAMQFDGVARPYSYAGNNLGRFYRTGNTFTNSLALSGGGENHNFRFSFTNLDNKGILPNSGLDRKTFSTNTSSKFGKLTASLSGSYVVEGVKNRPGLSDSPGNANWTVASLPPSINVNDLIGDSNKPGALPNGTELLPGSNAFVNNPWWAAHQFETNSGKNRIFGNASLSFAVTEDLTVSSRVTIDQFTESRRRLTPYGTGYSPKGQLGEFNRNVQEVNLEATIGYIKDISSAFGINLLVGGNQQKNNSNVLGINGSNLNIPFLHTLGNLANQNLNHSVSKSQVNSVFGQAEFSLNSALYLTVTGRQDWFSTLTDPNGAESVNSIFYPSVGLAYDLANGLELPSIFDFAKLRATWAQVGGATDPYQLGLQYGIFAQGHLGQPLGRINGSTIPPLTLRPSTNTELEIGADFRMLKGRIRADIAYYSRETTDGILDGSVSQTSGYASKKVNVGKITNKGVELFVEFTPILQSNFTWNIGFNFAQNNNKVVSLLTPEDDGETFRLQESRTRVAYVELVEGQPYSQVQGFSYERDASGNIVLDENGLPVQGALAAFGTGVHPTTLGINNSFKFGDVNFSFLIDMKKGGVIYNATSAYSYRNGLHLATLEGRETGLGVVAAEDISTYYNRIGGSIGEEFIQNADFVKLREVVLGYNLPNDLIQDLPFESATISFAARNLLTISKNTDNIDPESTYTTGNGQGLELFGVPVTRSYGLNLKLKF
ncbi:MAG: SusC/RagA family TonB-linked outer membrane protein [Saprospiraceae bacterium]